MSESLKQKIDEVLRDLTDEEKLLLREVVRAERQKLHLQKPRGILDLLREATEGTVL